MKRLVKAVLARNLVTDMVLQDIHGALHVVANVEIVKGDDGNYVTIALIDPETGIVAKPHTYNAYDPFVVVGGYDDNGVYVKVLNN